MEVYYPLYVLEAVIQQSIITYFICMGKNHRENNANDLQSVKNSQQNGNRGFETRNFGCWSEQEQQKYIAFLEVNKQVFQNRQKRKSTRIFKLMSLFLQTRNGIQCRSHHAKQLKAHRNKIRNILSSYKKSENLQNCCVSAEKIQRNKVWERQAEELHKNLREQMIVKSEEANNVGQQMFEEENPNMRIAGHFQGYDQHPFYFSDFIMQYNCYTFMIPYMGTIVPQNDN